MISGHFRSTLVASLLAIACGGESLRESEGAGQADSGSGDDPVAPSCPNPMVFEDPGVEKAVRRELGEGAIGPELAATLETLIVSEAKSWADLRCFPRVKTLGIYAPLIDPGPPLDIAGLGALSQLERLSILDFLIIDTAPLGGLEALSSLSLSGVGEIDIAFLGQLTHLRTLELRSLRARDLSGLQNLTSLTELTLADLGLTEIPPLPPAELDVLDLASNQIVDASGIAALPSLRTVRLNDNAISDLTSLAQIPHDYDFLGLTGNPFDCEAQRDNLAILEQKGAVWECLSDP